MNGGVLYPPVGVCAVCGKVLALTADRCTMRFDTQHAGRVVGKTFEVHACGSAHMAEAMTRVARMIQDAIQPTTLDKGQLAAAGVKVR